MLHCCFLHKFHVYKIYMTEAEVDVCTQVICHVQSSKWTDAVQCSMYLSVIESDNPVPGCLDLGSWKQHGVNMKSCI